MLLSSFEIKGKTVPNRIVMPPMVRYTLNDTTGRVTPASVEHYRRAARGVGLVVAEAFAVAPEGRLHPHMLGLWEDEQIEGAAALAAAIHQSGAVALVQLCYAGLCSKDPASAQVGPSEEYYDITRLARPLTVEEIHAIQRRHVEAALRAKAAGFDGVEVHGTHGYLYCRFMDKVSNRRRDEYGGDTAEGRTRIMTETLEAIRKAVGEDFIVAIRMGGCDYMEGGSTIEECVEACKLFEKAGIDLIDLSGGMCGYLPAGKDAPYFEDLSAAVKAAVNVPIIVTGGVEDGETAERLLRENACDMVGIGRALLRDPNWPENQVYK